MNNDILTSTFIDIKYRLLNMASKILDDHCVADDALQDAFYRLWKHKEEIVDRRQAEAMSFTAVRNQCIDKIRSRRDNIDINEVISDEIYDKEDNDIYDKYNDVISIINAKLPSVQRDIIRRRDIYGESYNDIAKALNMTPENVRVNISRARKIVRECYLKSYENDEK